MRKSRSKKYKSRFHLFMLVGKVVMAWYLILFSTTYLTADTAAYFTTSNQSNGVIYTGEWEEPDNSTLAFIEKGNKNLKACEPVTLKMKIKNTGDGDMLSESSYDVYYIENGNPQKHGEKVELGADEGIIKALKMGETAELTYKASLPGRYVFVAYQHSDHPDEETWSKEIKVDCKSDKQPDNKEKSVEEAEEEKNVKESEQKEETVENSKDDQKENEKVEEKKAEDTKEEQQQEENNDVPEEETDQSQNKEAEQKEETVTEEKMEKQTNDEETSEKGKESEEGTGDNDNSNQEGEGDGN
ncbi:amyloid fiber anchoring/assembly protein TapA [Virgibacillus ainsalahensis]